MLHGWMDVSASFQFVVDALRQSWHVIAPDWRGYGLTERSPADVYWFSDYLADLDAILDRLSPAAPVRLVGHSMGANIALLYAGVRPERVAGVVNLEGFGLRGSGPDDAPGRYARWLSELRERPALKTYSSLAEVAARLRKTNPRLAPDRADFLAVHWAEELPAGDTSGRWALRADPAHKIVHPTLYRSEEVLACWRRIAAPVLWVQGKESATLRQLGIDDLEDRIGHIPRVQRVDLGDAGHMLHHDQPERVASLIEDFFQS
jgi:pimeloyl-ACP methyl ester carboxylesterase